MKTANILKRLLILACLPAALCVFSLAANAEIVRSGSCGAKGDGKNLTWTLDDAGTLTITGTGAMSGYSIEDVSLDYLDCTIAPWGGSRAKAQRIKTVVIKNGVTNVGSCAFQGCTKLKEVTIPDSVTRIGEGAFFGCTGLTSVSMGNGVKDIDYGSFYGCTGLTEVTIPNSVTTVERQAFFGCTGLTEATISDGVTRIGGSAFSGCTGLTSVTIPDSVTSIDGDAFYNCTGLTAVTIGAGLSYLRENVFCRTGLTELTVSEKNPTFFSVGNCMIRKDTKSLTVGCQSSVIPEDGSVTGIGNFAFSGCTGLTAVTIPDVVTGIGRNAFAGCENLTSVTIPDSVTNIDKTAFSGCLAIRSLSIGKTIETLALADCEFPREALEKIDLQESVTGFAAGAFKDCVKVTFIDIPDGVATIDAEAFSGCPELAAIVVPGSVTMIKNNAFYNDSRLKTIFFDGTEQQWKNVMIEDGNIALLRADIICLAETEVDPDSHTEHIWHKRILIKAPTCAETGAKEYTCVVCGATKTEELAKTTAHKWDDGVVTAAATETADGVKTFTCAVCGATKTEPIPKLGPVFTPGDVDGDGKLTSADARLALRASVGLERYAAGSAESLACDADGDNQISSADARLILRASVGLEDPKALGKKA